MQRVMGSAVGIAAERGWDDRLYPGVAVRAIPAETRGQLAQALGALGVEAEYVLALVGPFARPAAPGMPATPATRAEGERLLWQLDASGRRLIATAESLEVATQAYLAELERVAPELRDAAEPDGFAADPAPWWPESDTSPFADGSLELGLCRCGYAYRHVVAAHLAEHTQAIGEQMALVLHALRTLPPAGVLPLENLHAGLYELAEAVQGDLVPRHLRDVSAQHPGLLSGIALLRRLDSTEDRSLAADIAWARGELAALDSLAAARPDPAAGAAPRRGFGSLFHRGPARSADAGGPSGAATFLAQARRDWTETIATLENLQAAMRVGRASGH